MDLAGVLGVPPRALSLNGALGLAFGARGRGGKQAPKAHFEPDRVVINLTKREGAGSLAHEWWHSVDNYFSRARGMDLGYLTETAHRPGEGMRPEMVEAFKSLIVAINKTGLQQRARKLDKRRAKDYWSTGREMAARSFESYIVAKLADNSQSNDYLANIVSQKYWDAAAALGIEEGGSYPYLEAAEIPVVRAAFDHFFDTVETRETERGVEMFSRATEPRSITPPPATKINAVIKRVASRWEADVSVRLVDGFADLPADIQNAARDQGSDGSDIRGDCHFRHSTATVNPRALVAMSTDERTAFDRVAS
jgi:hypothetical protein